MAPVEPYSDRDDFETRLRLTLRALRAQDALMVEMVKRVLLIVNRSAGTGFRPPLVAALLRELKRTAGRPAELELEIVDDHPGARSAAGRFLHASSRPAALIVGGGGGTLRAAVEGVCDAAGQNLPSARQVRIGALRLGSGNVVARRLGVAFDPIGGIGEIGLALREGRTTPCAVIRCRFGTAGGGEDVRHAVTMCGLGQFGRTSGDLVRWHRRLRGSRNAFTSLAGIERLNNLEYAVSFVGRAVASVVYPPACERVEVTLGEGRDRFRLLAGAVMNCGIGAIPLDPGVAIGEPAAGVLLLTRSARLRRWRLGEGETLRVTLLDRESVEFFLDEDSERAFGGLEVEMAGTLAFLPGSAERMAA